jgi:hypothetical protein
MIEDIEYLKDNCESDATIVYIDSSERNRKFDPYPQEYSMGFDQPFKLVTGFDILDASIPTTMWNVDKYNGTLALTNCTIPTTTNVTAQYARKFMDELRDVVTFSRLFERAHITGSINENFVVVISKEYSTSQSITASEVYTPYFAYVRDTIRNSSVKEAPKNLDISSYYTFSYVNIPYYIDYSDSDTIDIISKKNFHIQLNDNNSYDIVFFEEINITEADYNTILNTKSYICHVKNLHKQISLGNYDITTLRTELNNVWFDEDIAFDASTLPDSKQGIYILRSAGYILVNASIGKLIKQIGFDTYPRQSENSLYSLFSVHENTNVFAGNFDGLNSYTIKAPGIVNLLGYRYLILRCKEMEDHLLGSYAYMKYTPGIGLFKLASAYNDVTHLRFDFVNLVRKPFHPIGKLAKLTFRFETQDGDLYDFKGVNHQMLFVIKFLKPTQKVSFNKSVLNPNYDPNYMKYMSNNRTIEYKEDSDNEEEFNSERYEEKYKKDIQTYDYSTSASENDDNTDDSEVEFDFTRR